MDDWSREVLCHVNTYQNEWENTQLNSEIVNKRYYSEDDMFKCISQGNLEGCLYLYNKNNGKSFQTEMEDVFLRFPHDPLRSYKNAMISLNTLCRIAARSGGVPAIVVASMSYKNGLKIENASSIEYFQEKFIPILLSDYCLVVQDFSAFSYSVKVREIVSYILGNLTTPLSVENLALVFRMNPSSLSRKFKQETGNSIIEFINIHRIKLAQYYLCRGKQNITEIAYLSGFQDSNYFCRVFKKLTSVTPSQYIKNPKTNELLPIILRAGIG